MENIELQIWNSFHREEEAAAGRSTRPVEDTLALALRGEATADDVKLNADELFSLGLRIGLRKEELLLLQLLASFDCRCGGENPEDLELFQWMKPKGPQCPFFLFKMQASAKHAQVSWWRKRKPRFSSERPGYNDAIRVARLGADGVLEQAGEGGQPGALCYKLDWNCNSLWGPKGEVVYKEGSDVPLRKVVLVRRLPSGDGICITSLINGLGVQLGEILFLLPGWACSVAVSFTEKAFKVPTKFTEEALYGRVDLNFINITVPLENLIKKLYQMYEEEECAKAMKKQQNKDDYEDMGKLVCLRAEQEAEQERDEEELMHLRKEEEKKKRESLQKSRDERNKNRCMRKELKKLTNKVNFGAKTNEEQVQDRGYEEENGFCTLLFSYAEESGLDKRLGSSSPGKSDLENRLEIPFPEEFDDCAKAMESELCQKEDMHVKFLEKGIKCMNMKSNDMMNLGGGSCWENSVTKYPLAA